MAVHPLSSISPTHGVHAALDELAQLDPGGLSDAGQVALLVELKRIESRVCAYRLKVLAAAEKAKAAERAGDTASWAAKHTREDGRETSRQTKLATGLKDRSATQKALDAGEISPDHAEAIVGAGQKLPEGLSAFERKRVEDDLVGKAKTMSPSALRQRARRALEALERQREEVDAHEEGQVADEEERARARTRVTIRDNHDGTVTGHFTLPVFHGHLLRKVLQTMTAPRRTNAQGGDIPGGSGAGDCGTLGATGAGPEASTETGGGAGAQAEAGTEAGAEAGAGLGAGDGALFAAEDAGPRAQAQVGTSAGAEPGQAVGLDGLPDPGRVAQGRRADWANAHGLALCELIEHLPTDHLSPRTAATIVVTLDEQVLRGRLAAAGLDTGEKISAAQARQLACNSGLVPAVLGGKSVPLDLGHNARFFTEPQRTALAIHHTACAADGCHRPYAWCELHHLKPWSDGGRTDLNQAVPLCHRHHRMIHDHRYQRFRSPGGGFTFTMRQ